MATLKISGRDNFEGGKLEVMEQPLIIYVNGYWNKVLPLAGTDIGEKYWGNRLKDTAKNYFGTRKELFINGAGTQLSNGKDRYKEGLKLATDRLKNTSSKFHLEVFKTKRKVSIITHSMGAAYSEGILEVLKKENVMVEKVIHLSPADNSDFKANYPAITYQIDISLDPVLLYKNFDDVNKIKNVLYAGLVKNPKNDKFGHMYTKEEAFAFNWFIDLEKVNFQFLRTDIKYIRMPSDGLGPATTTKISTKIYSATKLIHNTKFLKVYKNGAIYHGLTNNEYESNG